MELHLDIEPGLIRFFLIGWRLLSSMSDRVVEAFRTTYENPETTKWLAPRPWLREEAKTGIRDLQNAVAQRRFGDARDAVIFLSIVFDTTACRAMVPLLDELPRFATVLEGSEDHKQVRWIASLHDVNRIGSLLSGLAIK